MQNRAVNRIEAEIDKSDYNNCPDFLNIRVDNIWLDEFMDALCPDRGIKGSIPTLCFGMERENEEKVVWERILPEEGATTYCPILMCPDDRDFHCLYIVAEIENLTHTIVWSKLGSDASDVQDPKSVGTKVSWFPNFQKFEFNVKDYLRVIEDFKARYEDDKIDYQIRAAKFAEEQKLKNK